MDCRFASKSAAIALYTLAGFSLLGTLGVDTKPLVAGLGVGGFTVGFALRVSAACCHPSSQSTCNCVVLCLIKPTYEVHSRD